MANDIILVGTVSSAVDGQSAHIGVSGVRRDQDGETPANDQWAYYGKFFKGQRAAAQDLGRRVVVTTQPYGEKGTLYVQEITFDPAPVTMAPPSPGAYAQATAPVMAPVPTESLQSFAQRLGAVPVQQNTTGGNIQIPHPYAVVDKDTAISRLAIAKSLIEGWGPELAPDLVPGLAKQILEELMAP